LCNTRIYSAFTAMFSADASWNQTGNILNWTWSFLIHWLPRERMLPALQSWNPYIKAKQQVTFNASRSACDKIADSLNIDQAVADRNTIKTDN